MAPRVSGLTGATLQTAPTVCHECVWWQSRGGRDANKERWIEKAEEDWGAWGTVYYDENARLLGSMQYGPAELFPRAGELPAGAPPPHPRPRPVAYGLAPPPTPGVPCAFPAPLGGAR